MPHIKFIENKLKLPTIRGSPLAEGINRWGSAPNLAQGREAPLRIPTLVAARPHLIVGVRKFILKPFAWLRIGNSLQDLGQCPILNLLKISLSSLPLEAPRSPKALIDGAPPQTSLKGAKRP